MYMYLQAVHCCLHGFRGVDYIDEDKAYEAFDSRALNKSCVAQVMENSGSRVLVELIDSESDGKETINSLLLQELCSEAKLTPVLPEVSGCSPLTLSLSLFFSPPLPISILHYTCLSSRFIFFLCSLELRRYL